MTVANTLYGVKGAGNISFFGLSSGELGLDLDYANKIEVSLKEDGIEYAKKNGKKAIKFDGEVSGELKISVDMMNGDLLAFINRSKLLRSATNIFKSEKIVITANNQVVTPKETIAGFLGAYIINADGTKKAKLSNATLGGDGKVTLTGVVVGDIVKIYYTTAKDSVHFSVNGTKEISEDYKAYCDVIGKQYEAGEKLPFQYTFYKVSPQSTIALTYDSTKVASFEITFDLLVDSDDRIVDYAEIPLVDEDVDIATPIDNLIGIAGNTQAILGFSPASDATSVKIEYKSGTDPFADIPIGGSTGIRIASAILASTNQVTVLGLTNGTAYTFRVVAIGGDHAGTSNEVIVTPTA